MGDAYDRYLILKAKKMSFEALDNKIEQIDNAIKHQNHTITQMKAKIDKMQFAMFKIMEHKCNNENNKKYLASVFEHKLNLKTPYNLITHYKYG